MTNNPYASPENPGNPLTTKRLWKGRVFAIVAILTIFLGLIALLLPMTRRARPAAFRTQCRNNLKQIALALHSYRDVHDALPPACTVDSSGKPLHSWRTLILPWLDEGPLYKSIDLSKPWNDPANAEAFKAVPAVFRCPSLELQSGHTTYLAVVGDDFCFHGTQPRQATDLTDEANQTLMVFEVALESSVPWMSPQDADESMVLSLGTSGTQSHTGGTQVAMADGSVHFLSSNLDKNTLRAVMTINGDEQVGEF